MKNSRFMVYYLSHICSYVGVPGNVEGRLIVTQSPLTSTVGDFWRMVWEQRAESVVVMATEEEGRWWPQGQGASQRHSLVIGRSWAEGKHSNYSCRSGTV